MGEAISRAWNLAASLSQVQRVTVHLSEQELQPFALAGALRQDVKVHASAVNQLCAHSRLAQSILQPGNDGLGCIPLHAHIVAQFVRPLLALCLRSNAVCQLLLAQTTVFGLLSKINTKMNPHGFGSAAGRERMYGDESGA